MSCESEISTLIQERIDFFNDLGKAVVLLDDQLNIKNYNKVFTDLCTESSQPLPGQAFLPLICPEDWHTCQFQLKKLLTGEESSIITEKRFKNKDGQFIWARIIAKRWQITNEIVLIFLLFDDVSDLKNTQKMLADSEIKYSELIENLPVAVFHIDLENTEPKIYFSRQFETLFHIARGSLSETMLNLRRVIHPDDLNAFDLIHRNIDKVNNFLVTEYRLINAHEDIFWVREQACLIRSEANKIIHIYGVMMDITEEKKNRQQLRQSEIQYQTLIESANDRIGVLDMEGKLVYGNSYFFEFLGLEQKDYLFENFVEYLHPNDREKHKKAFAKVFKTGSASYEYRIRHKNGQYLYMHNKITLIKNEKGVPEGILSINRDITRIKKIEKELIDAKMKAEESDRLKSAFLANMSHEIRTPLNGIIGFSKLLTNPDIVKTKRDLYSNIIERNSQQLLSLISDIIDLAKIESDQLKISVEQINLNDLLDDIYHVFLNELKIRADKQIELIVSTDFDRDNSFIIADRHRLVQIFNNLLGNAIKFTEEGSIEFGYRYSGKNFFFYVKDTGTGISKEHQAIIFEPFRQEDETITRRYGGTGLGLAICKRLVHLMGGTLGLESEKGSGSMFYFSLNLPISEIKNLRQPSFESFSWTGKTILIVDDNKDVITYLNEIMSDSDAKIIFAESGEEAIEICNWTENIDLVLMDIQMPKMDGYTATKKILELHPSVPIIAQTAHAMSGDNIKCFEAGCIGYISKPIDKEKLQKLIASTFNETRP